MLLLCGCASTIRENQYHPPYVQDPNLYLKDWPMEERLISGSYQKMLAESFRLRLFNPWLTDTLTFTSEEANWSISFIREVQGYGENKLPRTSAWIETVIRNADTLKYGKIIWKGINTVRSDLRALPTIQPFYKDFNKAGEGFPFDYLQNSALPVNTPVRVLNQSTDKAWLLVESHHALGWIPYHEICRVDSMQQALWMRSELITPVLEPISILDTLGGFMATARIGSLFPLVDSTESDWLIAVMVNNGSGQGQVKTGLIRKNECVIQPWPLTLKNTGWLTGAMLGQTYGWGGLFHDRDCSALTKDFLTPFGIWIPRHSSDQAKITPFQTYLADLKPKLKEQVILKQGIPFLTLLWKPGHVMLYAGFNQKQPVVLHALWGLETRNWLGKEGRYIIGETVLTSLAPGKDIGVPHRRNTLLDRIECMTFLVNPDSLLIIPPSSE